MAKRGRSHVVTWSLGTRGSKRRQMVPKRGLDVWDMSVETYLVNGVLRASVEGEVVRGQPKGRTLCNNGLASLRAYVLTSSWPAPIQLPIFQPSTQLIIEEVVVTFPMLNRYCHRSARSFKYRKLFAKSFLHETAVPIINIGQLQLVCDLRRP